MRGKLARLIVGAAILGAPPATAAAPDGVAEGTAALQWLSAQSCPALGSPLDVPGLRTPQEIAQVKGASLAFARQQTDALLAARTSRDRVVGERASEGKDAAAKRKGLLTLDAATTNGVGRMSATLVRWLLAEWVELAALAPDRPVVAGSSHPLEPFIEREHEVEGLVRRLDGMQGVQVLLVPLIQRAHICLVTAQNQIVEANANALLSLAADATASAPLEGAIARYAVMDPTFGAGLPEMATPAVVATLRDQINDLRAQERDRADKVAIGLAKRNAAARATLTAQAGANLRIARTFTELLQSRSTAPMRRLLHPEVVLSGPNGTRNGRDTVIDALTQILGQSQTFTVGEPQMDSESLSIVAAVASSRGQAKLRFQFIDGLISLLRFEQ